MRRVASYLLGAVLIAVLATVPAAAHRGHGHAHAASAWPAEPHHAARPSSAFQGSVGVNVHMSYGSTAYADKTAVENALRYLGVRHLRDGACAGCTWVHPSQQKLSSDLGARWTWIAGDPRNTTGTLDANVTAIATKFATVTDALENPNEWDTRGGAWASELRSYAAALKAERDQRMPGTPILAPSLVYAGSRTALGDLSAYVDAGNMHAYNGQGTQPDTGFLTNELALAAKVTPKTPQATEIGYHNALNTTSGFRPISERADGYYAPREYLEFFRRGVARSFVYELVDERPEPALADIQQHFGLFRNDWTPKPAATAIRAMLQQAGTGTPRRPGGLDYAITAPTSVHSVLLQDGAGTYRLALWRTAAAWDPKANDGHGQDVPVGSGTATVTWGQRVTAGGVVGPASTKVLLGGGPVFVQITTR